MQARELVRFMEQEERLGQQLPAQTVVRQENHELVCERLSKNKPSSFKGETDPLLAVEWIWSLDAIFYYINAPDEEKVSCTTFMFQMEARYWWDSMKTTTDISRLTWEWLMEIFCRKYFSEAHRMAKSVEFSTLK